MKKGRMVGDSGRWALADEVNWLFRERGADERLGLAEVGGQFALVVTPVLSKLSCFQIYPASLCVPFYSACTRRLQNLEANDE